MFWKELTNLGPKLSPRFTSSLDSKLYADICKIGPLLHVAVEFCLMITSAKQIETHQTLIEDDIRRPRGL